jgi:16S rRNA (cytidine1402-2'-O)-methyltransferase
VNKGKLFLLPCPIAEENIESISNEVRNTISNTKYYIVENARTTRRFIKQLIPAMVISELTIFEMDKHAQNIAVKESMQPLEDGFDIGLISEAGNPCIADPGHLYVNYAHKNNIEVVPLAGPSSILLALIASGFSGQQFTFHGYLPNKRPELSSKLKQVENEMLKSGFTQIFMETPYRNEFMLETLCSTLNDKTLLCIAMNIGSNAASIKTMSIQKWKSIDKTIYHKKPSIFLIGK